MKKDSGFSIWHMVGAVTVAMLATMVFGMLFSGCPGPKPDVVVVPPQPPGPQPPGPVVPPVPSKVKKIILIRESGIQSDSLARLVESLRGGQGEKWLAEREIELLGIIDPGDQDATDQPCAMVKQWKEEFEGQDLPLILVLDQDNKLIRKHGLPASSTTLHHIQALLVDENAGEPDFAALPYVDCEWADWSQFTPGDTTEVKTFDGDTEPVLKGAEPKFGAPIRGPPATGLLPEEGDEPSFEDAIPLIPRDQWPTAIKGIDDAGGSLDLLVTRIYDQGREGSCVSNATCQTMEIAQAVRRGRSNVIHLSGISLYKRVGRSPGSGSMVSANLKEILARGVLPLKSPENDLLFKHTMPNTGFYSNYPAGWEQTAIRFRAHEVFDVRSYDGFITALLRGYPVCYGRSGHSICAVRPVYRNGKLFVKYANSWSTSFGEGGFGYDSENMIRSGASWAFAVRTVVDPGLPPK